MAGYTDAIRQRFMQPQYVHTADTAADYQLSVGAVEQGALLQLFFMVDAQAQRVKRVTFKVYGCGVCIAFADLLCEHLTGMALKDIATINTQQLAQDLSVPSAKMHCVWLANEAVEAFLYDND